MEKEAEKMLALKSANSAMPDLFLVNVVSRFDNYVASLIRAILSTKPEILQSSEKTFSLKDLIKIGSIEEAREEVVTQVIDRIMRDSHEGQISWMESRVGLSIKEKTKLWADFIELCERRNIIVHNSGQISDQYRRVCAEAGHDVKLDVGKRLGVTRKYLDNGLDTFLEFGVKLNQVLWRKLFPHQLPHASTELALTAYKLLVRRRNSVAARLFKFGLTESKRGPEAVHRMMVINYASAEKLCGNMEHARKIVDAEDWSATHPKFSLCVAGVKEDLGAILATLPSAAEQKLFTAEECQSWPAFEQLKSNAEFVRYLTSIQGTAFRRSNSTEGSTSLVSSRFGRSIPARAHMRLAHQGSCCDPRKVLQMRSAPPAAASTTPSRARHRRR